MSKYLVWFLAAVCCLSSAQSDFRRTVVAIEKTTTNGEYLFLRGGTPSGRNIPIRHNIHPENQTSFYAQTSEGDDELGWGSYQSGQGVFRQGYMTRMAEGTPMIWTTNDTAHPTTVEKDGAGYWELNTGGSHYWVVDFDMDCNALPEDWFVFKGYLIDLYRHTAGWEGSYINQDACQKDDSYVNIPRAQSWNHYGKCGYFNIVRWNDGDCMFQETRVVVDIVNSMDRPETLQQY